jgi:hypothetical protein
MKEISEAKTSVLARTGSRHSRGELRSELVQYRYETIAMLQRYFDVSLALGRLPPLFGGEMFRSKVTAYRASTFEDMAIFVVDMGACIARLGEASRKFISLHVFQDYSIEESASKMGCYRTTAWRIYSDALDEMSEILLRFGLLEPMDWIGDRVAAEGWFEGCPVLQHNPWLAETLPPKKPCGRAQMASKVLRMPRKA